MSYQPNEQDKNLSVELVINLSQISVGPSFFMQFFFLANDLHPVHLIVSVTYKPVDAVLLWEKNIILWLIRSSEHDAGHPSSMSCLFAL